MTGDLTIQKQRKSAVADAEPLASLDEVIVLLKRQSRRLEGRDRLANRRRPAVGLSRLGLPFGQGCRPILLMAELPEIGTLSNKAIAKLVGLAPIASDSGRRSGRRPVRGGREGPRSSLSLVALTVARYGPHPGAFHQS
ncbi:transposase [Mesorhizobium sp. M0633]|uniref:transposase n=2 Tax=unclassified Mesorhizobium TaxID=325217 RepID=UPI00333BB7A9